MKCPVKPGMRGWLATGLVILAVELLDETTLSASFRDFSRTPNGLAVTCAGWSLLTAHLFGVIPDKYDPIVQVFSHMPKRRRVVVVVV